MIAVTVDYCDTAVLVRCCNIACCCQMKGEAEAFAVEAKAKAEAEQMEKKASAWKEYEDAAVVDMILDVLPKVCILRLCFWSQIADFQLSV